MSIEELAEIVDIEDNILNKKDQWTVKAFQKQVQEEILAIDQQNTISRKFTAPETYKKRAPKNNLMLINEHFNSKLNCRSIGSRRPSEDRRITPIICGIKEKLASPYSQKFKNENVVT
jgi:hypothetical protein